jgi:branched-chain amino acid aminotransferase
MRARGGWKVIYFDGNILWPEQVKISPEDRGFLLGDGLFETMKAINGRVLALKEHWQRLKNSADYLEIPLTMTVQDLEKVLTELLCSNCLTAQPAGLRLTFTRGIGPRGLLPPAEPKPVMMVTAFPWSDNPGPIRAHIVDVRRNELSPLAGHKTLSYMENVLAKMAAVKAGAQEAILLNSQGHVAEASSANIFIVTRGGTLATPRLEDGALPGIMRRQVIVLANTMNLPVEEKMMGVEELSNAAEIFLTNSLIGLLPVNHLGPVTQRLQKAFAVNSY